MSADLRERILAQLAKTRASSEHPARAADLLALVGGEEPAYWSAIEQLYAERCINTVHIKRQADPEPWLAIWPTGLPLGNGAWSSASHSALFVKHRPNDLYDAHAPRSVAKAKPAPTAAPKPKTEPEPQPAPTPEPETESTKEICMDAPTNLPRAKGALQAAVAAHIAGRTKADALTVAEIADLLADEPDNVRFAVRALVEKKTIAQIERVLGRRKVGAFFDPVAETAALAAAGLTGVAEVPSAAEMLATVAEAPVAAEPEQGSPASAVDRRAPQPLYRAGDPKVKEVHEASAPERVEFALWDDGRLTIAAEAEILLIPADATKRLALLLGVPGNPLVSPLGA